MTDARYAPVPTWSTIKRKPASTQDKREGEDAVGQGPLSLVCRRDGREYATAGTVHGMPVRRGRLLPIADSADAHRRTRARVLTLLARLDASADEWRAQGRPPADLLRVAPAMSLDTLARVRLAVTETLARLDG